MATTCTTGKAFTLATAGTVYDLSTTVPTVFSNTGIIVQNSSKSIVNLLVKSTSSFAIQLQDYTTGVWTDIDTIPVSGSYAVFSISNISVMDIRLRPSANTQAFYTYLSAEI
jgi:hypothetical protein